MLIMSNIGQIIRKVVWSRSLFEFWQRLGVNVTKKHFYSPIPDTRELSQCDDLWNNKLSIVGIDMNPGGQLRLLEEVFARYKSEFNFTLNKTDIEHEFYLNNAGFGLEDAEVLYCMIRNFKPKTIIEVGSGHSTLIAARACLINRNQQHHTQLISIEPYPRKIIKNGFPGLEKHLTSKAEDVDLDFFSQLVENDILFIDSSHVMRIGNDVNFLFLEILPRLKKGVLVHIHDIFFPYHYPRQWVIENRVFWTEQYLLQAFLCFNKSFEVIFGNNYMLTEYPDKMHNVFSHPPGYRQRNLATSFWIRKTG